MLMFLGKVFLLHSPIPLLHSGSLSINWNFWRLIPRIGGDVNMQMEDLSRRTISHPFFSVTHLQMRFPSYTRCWCPSFLRMRVYIWLSLCLDVMDSLPHIRSFTVLQPNNDIGIKPSQSMRETDRHAVLLICQSLLSVYQLTTHNIMCVKPRWGSKKRKETLLGLMLCRLSWLNFVQDIRSFICFHQILKFGK